MLEMFPRPNLFAATLFAIIATSFSSNASAAENDTLLVRITNVSSDAPIQCVLHDSSKTWLTAQSTARATASHTKEGAVCEFAKLPHGTYAVAVHQDLNQNGEMDFTMLGLPDEPWGVSRDAPARLSAPTFSAASFAFKGSGISLKLR